MSIHSECAYVGPDIYGRTFKAEPCLHVAAFREHERLERKRQAIIEHNRLMKEQRRFAATHRDRIAAEWDALESPPRRIHEHTEHVRNLRAQWPWRKV